MMTLTCSHNTPMKSAFALLLFGVLCLCAMPGAGAEDGAGEGGDDRMLWIAGWVALSGQGEVTGFEFDPDYKLPEALKGPADSLVRATRFEPAVAQGEGRPSRSWMRATLRLEPRGESYAVALESPYLGPRPHDPFFVRGIVPPTTPVRVLLTFEVTGEGRTRAIEVESMDGRLPSGLPRRLEDKIRSLRFDPVEVDGAAITTVIRQPLALSRHGRVVQPFDLPPLPRDPAQPGATGQTAYSTEIFITAKIESMGSFRP